MDIITVMQGKLQEFIDPCKYTHVRIGYLDSTATSNHVHKVQVSA